MSRGGRRSGAGRKVGSPNRFDKRAAEQAAAEGKRPHEVLFEWGMTGTIPGVKRKLSARDRIYCLTQCAPYIVPRLNAIAVAEVPRIGESRPWDALDPLEKLELGRRVALILGDAGRAADELAKQEQPPAPAEPQRQLPYRPQPGPEPRVEWREPISEHAVEVLGRSWPILAFERAARLSLAAIPSELQPEIVYDVNGERPVPMVVESPKAYRERLVAAGFDLERATVQASFAEPQRSWVRPQVVTRRP